MTKRKSVVRMAETIAAERRQRQTTVDAEQARILEAALIEQQQRPRPRQQQEDID